MDLRGVAAIVTGGASGLGRATTEMLAGRGAKVAIFDLNDQAGMEIAERVGGLFQKVDVADERSVADGLSSAEGAHGVARVLVNCAGVSSTIRVVATDNMPHSLQAFRRIVEINLIGTFTLISQFAARVVGARIAGEEAGLIVNTASIAAYDGLAGHAAYSASKGGVVGMTLPLARDLAQHRIRVMTIAPGIFLTPMVMGLSQAAQDALRTPIPHPSRLGHATEYAQLVESIIANPMLNGEVIRLDAALRMTPG